MCLQEPVELEETQKFQKVVSVWVLGTKTRGFARAVSVPRHGAIPPALLILLKQGLSLNLQVLEKSGQLSMMLPISLPPSAGLQVCTTMPDFFYDFWTCELMSSCLLSMTSPTEPSPQSCFL